MNMSWSKYLIAIVIVLALVPDGLTSPVDESELFFKSQGEELMRLVGFMPRTNDVVNANNICYKWVKSVNVDGTNIVFSCEKPDQKFVFWEGMVDGRRIMRGEGAVLTGSSPEDIAISVFADRVSSSSAPIELLASQAKIEENHDGSTWVVWSVGRGRCAYIKGSSAIWMSGFRANVALAKRIIKYIIEQS